MINQVLACDFSGVYRQEGFLAWLEQDCALTLLDFSSLEGTSCYCSREAEERIVAKLEGRLPRERWIDSGDFHYMSHLLALKETEPFHLLLLDNHTDDQPAAFGGILSCGSWVKAMKDGNPMLKDVLTIGPEGCEREIPETWLEKMRGENIYVSLDKDIMDRAWARTDWTQGSYSLENVLGMLGRLFSAGCRIIAVDICGELPQAKGATEEELEINRDTNIELHIFISKYLN